MLRLFAAIAIPCLIQFSYATQQNSTVPPPPVPDTARIRAEVQQLEGGLSEIADRGAALFLLSKRYAQLGELPKALSLLKECISLDEGFDPSESSSFQVLKSTHAFQQLIEQVHRSYPPVHRAKVAFTVQQEDLFPEGLAVDSARHLFYMGSMHHKKIIMITDGGKISDFVKPKVYGLFPLGGIKVDPSDHSVWAASDNDHDSELLHFDSRGKLLQRFAPPGAGPHVLNDLVLHHSREIYVTDTFAQQVYRFDRETHSFAPVALPRPVLYPNGIALSDDGNLLYVADSLGVLLVDLPKTTSVEVKPGPRNTLAGIDGLYWYKNSLLGVQYGTGSYRVVRWRLAADGLRVISTEVLEHRTPLVSDPTTGAVSGRKFYFIANTGISNLNDDKVVDPKKLEPIHIAVVPLDD